VRERRSAATLEQKRQSRKKKWRSRAWSIDPNRTNLTILVKEEKRAQHVPPWIHKKMLAAQFNCDNI
jgi:hypothetical protein